MPNTLPYPDARDLERSHQLMTKLLEMICTKDHMLPFSEYVEACLYTPDLGYYESGNAIFGEAGDFTTAPELTPLFSQALVRHYVKMSEQHVAENILELGAGSGVLCSQILTDLQVRQRLPRHYYILERSSVLRKRQQDYLCWLPDVVFERIKWIDFQDLSEFSGLVIANEVFDALPFDLFMVNDEYITEKVVGLDAGGRLILNSALPRHDLMRELKAGVPDIRHENYHSECSLHVQPLLQQLAISCGQAVVCIIDYGHSAAEYYHPDRHMGTMVCHIRNHVHDEPLQWPGLQDISCSVNFSQVARHAHALGLHTLSYSPLAHFLLANDILPVSNTNALAEPLSHESQNLKKLLLPSEMGERFQVLVLGKNVNVEASSLSLRDFSYKL